ncbi:MULTISPECIES: SUKH-4 family immunity protein [Streptomyces]|uniref:SUKH-4 family immunity protein n=1 Tax=Streptomyces siderophoricus TaxID=2802281 RepID=A0ABS1MPK5_9ACTN|nr:SUKH-4 family immunity protein [Streptomyces sp. 9-7]MBL1089648.1 SUKH-4 family immunity protein [Streptomyces sp. 9-7]
MPEPTPDTPGIPGIPEEEVAGRVGAWWRAGGLGGQVAFLVPPVGHDASAVMREIPEHVPGSVVVDATGLTAEQVMQQALTALGVDLSPDNRDDWRFALGAWPEERLLLVVNAHRAGPTRRSYEPERLVTQTLPWLARGKLTVLVHVVPGLLPARVDPRAVFRLSAAPVEPLPAVREFVAVRALALAEPRCVPLPVWAQLVTALTGEAASEDELAEFATERSGILRLGPLGVSFVDEGLAEALRREIDSADLSRVNRHMVAWLMRSAPGFRHPEGWSKHGAVGLYAATGLAMHAVQAGTYDEALRDGRVIANLPQTALMDAARSITFLIPGNSPAADAIHLWGWGIVPRSQGEWASWLHLMARSRNDLEFASSVASSGVSLPWRTKWAHWRPPGGYHVRFLEAGRFVRLAEVRWQGRPAIAGLQQRTVEGSPQPYVTVRDLETGELVAGPWEQDEIPQEHRTDLALPPATTTPTPSASQAGESPGHPTRLRELFDSSSLPRSRSAFLLPCTPLSVGDVVVFGGDLGLIAIQSADGVDPSDTFGSRQQPLSWDYADSGPSVPVDATPPNHRDLIALFGEDDIYEAEPEEIPAELTHQPTRALCTEFGLPDMNEGAMALLPYGNWEVDLFDEVDWPGDVEPVAERGPFFQIGTWMGGEIVIDGPTGHILRVPSGPDEEYLAGLPAARSLESFLTMVALWVTGLRTRDLLPPGNSERGQITYWVLGELATVDERGGGQPAWSYVLHNE